MVYPEYCKLGNFVFKIFHAIIFHVKIFSYASRSYENILTKIFNLEYVIGKYGSTSYIGMDRKKNGGQ